MRVLTVEDAVVEIGRCCTRGLLEEALDKGGPSCRRGLLFDVDDGRRRLDRSVFLTDVDDVELLVRVQGGALTSALRLFIFPRSLFQRCQWLIKECPSSSVWIGRGSGKGEADGCSSLNGRRVQLVRSENVKIKVGAVVVAGVGSASVVGCFDVRGLRFE